MNKSNNNFFSNTKSSTSKTLLYIFGGLVVFALILLFVILIADSRYALKNTIINSGGNAVLFNVPNRSSANQSVVLATDVYEVPYNLMTDGQIADRLDSVVDVSVFVYREGINFDVGTSQISQRGYYFEKWNSSINNMFTDNGILFSATAQGFSDDSYMTRYFIKPKTGTTFPSSTYKTDFCAFLGGLNLVLRKSTITVVGKAGDNSDLSTASTSADGRANGDYFKNDDWNFTIFGAPDPTSDLCA